MVSTLRRVVSACGVVLVLALSPRLEAQTQTVRVPMTCSRGGGHTFSVVASAPDRAPQGATYTLRLDSFPSGKIEHAGLRHLRDMEVEYLLPAGARFVEGSARIVPNTGTPNVAKTAQVWQANGVVHLKLPAKVETGDSYTPPSIELQLVATAAAGSELPLKLLRYRVVANAVIVGDVTATCDPTPSPFTLASTTVTKS